MGIGWRLQSSGMAITVVYSGVDDRLRVQGR